ncbi:hypothetical protein LAZ67_17001899 [Cordylochernes scorpioides]|uniref:Protein kinase domain-containing protein n=1 Tax=Cordylochernes scorpioides TaxID=51811 RepID=A0ABY6LF25_9ARAC|nr:hypothetical protein LAZ67_17001899 [Cordylochernes scorpioides]
MDPVIVAKLEKYYKYRALLFSNRRSLVYAVTDNKTNKTVALKATKHSQEKERDNLLKLQSKHIVGLHRSFALGNVNFLALEYCPRSVRDVIKGDKHVSPAEICFMVNQMAEGLNFLHKKRIVHRDIKPGNMLLSWDGHLKISDLEFAVKLEDIDFNYCQFGTSCYCAPEILLELGYYNTKIDMWALGIIVAMFYTKNEIFESRSREEILEMICKMLGTKRVKSLDVNNEKFANIPEFTKPDWSILDKVPKKALSFIKNLLEPDPKTRWSSEQCLKDDFLTDKRRKNPKFNHIPNKYGTSRNAERQLPGESSSLVWTSAKRFYLRPVLIAELNQLTKRFHAEIESGILAIDVGLSASVSMELPLVNVSTCELRSVIRFFTAKNETAVNINRNLVSVYGE